MDSWELINNESKTTLKSFKYLDSVLEESDTESTLCSPPSVCDLSEPLIPFFPDNQQKDTNDIIGTNGTIGTIDSTSSSTIIGINSDSSHAGIIVATMCSLVSWAAVLLLDEMYTPVDGWRMEF